MKHGSLAVFLHDSEIVQLCNMGQRNEFFCASLMALQRSGLWSDVRWSKAKNGSTTGSGNVFYDGTHRQHIYL